MKIAVAGDVQKERNRLALRLQEYIDAQGLDARIVTYSKEDQLLEAWNGDQKGYDVIFLHMCRDGQDGMNIARQIRRRSRECKIILTAETEAFAVEGYEIQAFGYLLKPYREDRLKCTLDRIFDHWSGKNPCIEVREERVMKKICLGDIQMAELQGHYTCFYLKSGETMKARMTVRELLSRIQDVRFLECYRNLLVNLDYVEGIEGGKSGWEAFRMKGGRMALIQKSRRSHVKQYFSDYIYQKDGVS